ncbi:MAG TPA: hypothetical protein VGB50_06155 [Flavobacterium sp.]|jgi:hypothetical protein
MKYKLLLFLLIAVYYTANCQNDTQTNFKVNVSNIESQKEFKQLVRDAMNLMNEILNTDEFKQRVLSSSFDWVDITKTALPRMTNQQVFDTLYYNKDHIMEVKITKMGLKYIKFWGSGTVGVTSLYDPYTITFNKDWLDLSPNNYNCTLLIYASHLAHEYCHQIGFADKNYDQPKYRNVVPYAIGDIFCDLVNKKYNSACKCKD